MLFFRTEEHAARWSAAHRLPRRPVATLDQLWRLSVVWYGNRLTPGARRPQPDEIREIFARIGLTDPFWDPQSDLF